MPMMALRAWKSPARQRLAIASITNATTTATLTTSAAHGLTTGNSVTVYGAYPYAYNGTYTITVTGATTFTYTMASNPGGSATTIGHLIGPGAATVDFTGQGRPLDGRRAGWCSGDEQRR